MRLRAFLALSLLVLLAAPLAIPTASAAGCLMRSVNGPFGLRVAYVQSPLPPGPVCAEAYVIVYLCAAHVDPNAPSVWFDDCQGQNLWPFA